MKKLLIIVLVLLSAAALAEDRDSVDALKERAEKANPKQQLDLYTRIAERQLDALDRAYNGGTVQQARSAMADVVDYSIRATQLAAKTGKKMKHTEIAMRKMSGRLEAIRKSLNVDDRPPVAEAIQKMESARTALLNRMFSK